MPRLAIALAAALCGPALGCGGAKQVEVDQSLTNIERELRGLRDAYEAQSRRLEVVQDRLALVEDQLEARALHGAPVPQRLPVVRLTPEPRAAAPVAPMPAERRAAPPMPAAPREVAAGTITQADIEALDGPAPRTRSRRRKPVPPPANAANAGNIGVARLQPQPDFEAPRRAPSPAPAAAVAPVADEPIAAFKAAERLYRAGDLVTAIGAFEAFVQRWPKHGYADNALYLSGRCRYARAEYSAALGIFRRVLASYPAGNQVPDALLMIGLTQSRLGRAAEGRETLTRLQAMYPDTAAARQAAAELDRSAGRM